MVEAATVIATTTVVTMKRPRRVRGVSALISEDMRRVLVIFLVGKEEPFV